jgi:integrase
MGQALEQAKKNLPTAGDQSELYQRALTAALGRSKSENTVRTYNANLKAFQTQGGTIPIDALRLAMWLETATNEDGRLCSIATLETRLAAVGAAHRSLNFPDPTTDPLVRETLNALKRERGTRQKQARPLLLKELNQICITKTTNEVRDIRDHALILTGWVCALRRSELAAVRLEDLTRVQQGYKLFIPHSKTDQNSEGVYLPIPRAAKKANTNICPVRMLERWIRLLKLQGIANGYVFRGINKAGQILSPLTAQSINLIIDERARRAKVKRMETLDGRSVMGFSGHSLRAGFITEGAQKGLPDWMLQATSRHSSTEMLRRYIRSARLFEDSAAGRML